MNNVRDSLPAGAVPMGIEKLSIWIEPRDNSWLSVFVTGDLTVDEGGIEILSPDIISVNASDNQINQLKIVLQRPPQYGYLEVRDRSGKYQQPIFDGILSKKNIFDY